MWGGINTKGQYLRLAATVKYESCFVMAGNQYDFRVVINDCCTGYKIGHCGQ